jgi:site-specific DNA-methyltransferase (adenine-specific)
MDKITLLKGDCLDWMNFLEPKSIDLILCDLPYGTTACKWDSVIPFEILWSHYLRLIKPNSAIVLTASQPFTSALLMSNPSMFKTEWIWEKNRGSNFANVKYVPMKEHESILVFGQGKVTYNPIYEERSEAGKNRSNYAVKPCNTGKRETINGFYDIKTQIIDANKRVPRSIQKFNTQVGLHPTQKPIALMEYLIKTYTNPNALVLDNCMGSGSTGVACLNTQRKFIGIEKDAIYFTIAEKRIRETDLNIAPIILTLD